MLWRRSTETKDDRCHLHIPINEALSSVGDNRIGTITACLTLAQSYIGWEQPKRYSSVIEISLIDCWFLKEELRRLPAKQASHSASWSRLYINQIRESDLEGANRRITLTCSMLVQDQNIFTEHAIISASIMEYDWGYECRQSIGYENKG